MVDINLSSVVVYICMYDSRKTVHADVVFVHGLLGGAVKTWRQQDKVMPKRGGGDSSLHTDCWPKVLVA